MKKYLWTDCFDGGDQSELLNTLTEVRAAAKVHIKDLRLNQRELDKIIKEFANYVSIESVELDNDGDIIESTREDLGAIEITAKTLSRIY